jgi:hypothetical protein
MKTFEEFQDSLESFKQLEKGWYDDEYGSPQSHALIDAIQKRFSSDYPRSLPIPVAFPTIDGAVNIHIFTITKEIFIEISNEDLTESIFISYERPFFIDKCLDLNDDKHWKEVLDLIAE